MYDKQHGQCEDRGCQIKHDHLASHPERTLWSQKKNRLHEDNGGEAGQEAAGSGRALPSSDSAAAGSAQHGQQQRISHRIAHTRRARHSQPCEVTAAEAELAAAQVRCCWTAGAVACEARQQERWVLQEHTSGCCAALLVLCSVARALLRVRA
jgi:hypothetical protein